MTGVVVHYLRDAKSGVDFPVQFFDDGSGNLIADVPFGKSTALVVGTLAAPGRALLILCTTAGDVIVQLEDNSTLTIPVNIGPTQLPYQVTKIVTVGTTATATYANLL